METLTAQELLLSEIGTAWMIGFWAILILFAGIEYFMPAYGDTYRKARWPTNLLLGVFNVWFVTLMPITALIAAVWAQSAGFGVLNVTIGQGWIAFFATILIRSLAGYGFHRATHKIPFLWRMHRVHHSDTHLDVTTSVRVHPAEMTLLIVAMTFIAGFGGLSPYGLIAYEIAESVNTLFTHTQYRLPVWLDRALRTVFVTPNMHALHHSSHQPETDSNYGGVFSFWDRLFGSYTTEPRGVLKYGLDEFPRERAASLWWQVKMPWVKVRRGEAAE